MKQWVVNGGSVKTHSFPALVQAFRFHMLIKPHFSHLFRHATRYARFAFTSLFSLLDTEALSKQARKGVVQTQQIRLQLVPACNGWHGCVVSARHDGLLSQSARGTILLLVSTAGLLAVSFLSEEKVPLSRPWSMLRCWPMSCLVFAFTDPDVYLNMFKLAFSLFHGAPTVIQSKSRRRPPAKTVRRCVSRFHTEADFTPRPSPHHPASRRGSIVDQLPALAVWSRHATAVPLLCRPGTPLKKKLSLPGTSTFARKSGRLQQRMVRDIDRATNADCDQSSPLQLRAVTKPEERPRSSRYCRHRLTGLPVIARRRTVFTASRHRHHVGRCILTAKLTSHRFRS